MQPTCCCCRRLVIAVVLARGARDDASRCAEEAQAVLALATSQREQRARLQERLLRRRINQQQARALTVQK